MGTFDYGRFVARQNDNFVTDRNHASFHMPRNAKSRADVLEYVVHGKPEWLVYGTFGTFETVYDFDKRRTCVPKEQYHGYLINRRHTIIIETSEIDLPTSKFGRRRLLNDILSHQPAARYVRHSVPKAGLLQEGADLVDDFVEPLLGPVYRVQFINYYSYLIYT